MIEAEAPDPGLPKHLRDRRALHKIISLIFEPSVVAAPLVLVLVYTRRHMFSISLEMAYLGLALLSLIIPLIYTSTLYRLGVISSLFYSRREDRIYFYPMMLVCILGVFLFFGFTSTSKALLSASFAAMVVGFGLAVFTLWHKVSYHLAGLGGILSIALVLVGFKALVFLPLMVLVAYSRTRLGAHTWFEVTVGGVFGMVTSAVAFQWFYETGFGYLRLVAERIL